jgi:hypothetical protein
MPNVIANAVAPLKDIAAARAVKVARETIAQGLADLAANSWDLNQCAPYPQSNIGRPAYMAAIAKRNLYQLIATYDDTKPHRKPADPYFYKQSDKSEELFVARSIKDAVHSYELWVAKLTGKVGEVVSAELEISANVLGYSILKVTKPDGSIQRWKTQMIVNCSSLGKAFNQWPTRLMK